MTRHRNLSSRLNPLFALLLFSISARDCEASLVVSFGDMEGTQSEVYEDRAGNNEINSNTDVVTGKWYGYQETSGSSPARGYFVRSNENGPTSSGTRSLSFISSNNTSAGTRAFHSTYQFIDTGNVSGAFELTFDYRIDETAVDTGDPFSSPQKGDLNVSLISIDDTGDEGWSIAQNDNTFIVDTLLFQGATDYPRDYTATGANLALLGTGGQTGSELNDTWYTQSIIFNLNSDIDQVAIAIDVTRDNDVGRVIYDLDNFSVTAVPEPSSIAFLAGVGMIVFCQRRTTERRAKQASRRRS